MHCGGADIGVVGGVDFLAEHEEEFARRAELLDPVVAGVGDVDVAGGGPGGIVDGDVGGSGERIGVGGGGGGGAEGGGEDVGGGGEGPFFAFGRFPGSWMRRGGSGRSAWG